MKRLLYLFLIATGFHSMSFGWGIFNPIKRWFSSSTTKPSEDPEEKMKAIVKELDHSNDQINEEEDNHFSVPVQSSQMTKRIYIKNSFRNMKRRWPTRKRSWRTVKNNNQ